MEQLPLQARAGTAFGLGMAAIVTTVFGFFWFGWGMGYGSVQWYCWVALYLAAIALVVFAVRAMRAGKALMREHPQADDSFRRTMGRRFGAISAAEFAACGVVLMLCIIFHRFDLLAAGISVVVGLHFIPLGGLFRFPVYYWTAAAIVAADAAAVLLLRGDAITVGTGVATGCVLWATALYALVAASRARATSAMSAA